MKIINKPYLDFPREEQCLLYNCFTHKKGFMRETIDLNSEGMDTFVVYHNDIIMGWAIVVGWVPEYKLLMIYVHEDNRRKGIGTSLVRAAKKKHKDVCIGIDINNKLFIDKMMFDEGIIVWASGE